MSSEYTNIFPAIRGVQAGRPCYIAMCPMRLIPQLFSFNGEDVPPELRAQRTLNISRIPSITNYLVENTLSYTLSSITASINAQVNFTPIADTGTGQNMGTLAVPMDAQILINDGQHRRAAIERAIKEQAELGHDHISVLFFIDEGLERSQQMFADLNKHAVRPSDSIATLYDHRDVLSDLARYVQKNTKIFSRLTELEKSSISNRSTKLFTLSAIKNATKVLLGKKNHPQYLVSDDEKDLACLYWTTVSKNMVDWQNVLSKQTTPYHLRSEYIHAHGVMLQAMGNIGREMLLKERDEWVHDLKKLQDIDWARSNPDWNGRALVHGAINKSRTSVILTGSYIKMKLGQELNDTEVEFEKKLRDANE